MKQNKLSIACSRGAMALLATTVAAGAFAQDGERKRTVSSTIDEVIVTAQKREQSTADLGISVSVLGGDQMSALGMQLSNDIVNFIPNIEHTAIFGPGTNPNYSIRGVTMNDYNDATEAPIATYMDEMYLVTTGAGSFPLYDMERVEVLRGPQGTLFGRNSTGGVMHFISKDPTDVGEGEIKVGVGAYDSRRTSGFLNAPINDRMQFRIAGYYSDNDGWMKHRTGNQPDGGEMENHSFRVSLALQPTDNINNVIKISHSKAQGHSTAVWADAAVTNPVTGLQEVKQPPGSLTDFGVAPVHEYHESDNGGLRELKGAESTTIINKLDWSISDNVTLTSVTGYNEYERDLVEDCDGTQVWICATHYDNSSHQFSQEFRTFMDFGAQRYTFGAYYLEQYQDVNQIAPLVVGLGGGGQLLDADAEQDLKGYAVFANAEFDLSDKFTLTTGLRVSYDEKEMDSRYATYASPTPDAPVDQQWLGWENNTEIPRGALLSEDLLNNDTGFNSFDKYSWNAKIGLDYKPTDDMLLYISFSRGTKAPGYNHGFISAGLPKEAYFYDEEELLSYEVGMKTTFWDQRANFNAAAFYYDYNDYHTLSYIGIGSFLTNSDAKLYGAEFDLTVKPIEGLTLTLNGGLLESTLYDVPNGSGIVGDWEMPIAPSWTLAGAVNYEMYVGQGHILGVQVDGRGRDSFTNDPADNPASIVKGYTTYNARAYFIDSSERWEISASVKNLTDKEYNTSIFLIPGLGNLRYGFYGPPRWWSADVTYKF
ncbi:MAG: TonB-dependent receptor [Porticoccaceae bacterium]